MNQFRKVKLLKSLDGYIVSVVTNHNEIKPVPGLSLTNPITENRLFFNDEHRLTLENNNTNSTILQLMYDSIELVQQENRLWVHVTYKREFAGSFIL